MIMSDEPVQQRSITLMWEESDTAEFEALKSALASATAPIRNCNHAFVPKKEGGQLWLHGNASKTEYTALYFWLCGYGDRMAVEPRKQPVCPEPTS
jgi:hypothetical protein